MATYGHSARAHRIKVRELAEDGLIVLPDPLIKGHMSFKSLEDSGRQREATPPHVPTGPHNRANREERLPLGNPSHGHPD